MSDESNGNGVSRFRHIPGFAAQTMKLLEKLKTETADEISYEVLSELIGMRVESTAPNRKGYGYLRSARNFCDRTEGILWLPKSEGDGLYRASDEEKLAYGESQSRQIHRKANRTTKTLQHVCLNELPEDKRSEYLARLSQLGTLAMMSRGDAMKKLTAQKANEPPPMKRLLEAFASHE